MPVEARAMKDLRGFLSPEQVEAMIEGCDNLRDRVLIRLLWRTGMRISELVRPGKDRSPDLGLRVTDILWQENALIIRHAKRGTSKISCSRCGTRLGHKFKFCPTCQQEIETPLIQKQAHPIRRIDIDPGTLAMVKEYLERRLNRSEFVIPITRQMSYLVVRQAAERVGITEVGDRLVSKRRHPHPHHLRHAFCTYVIKKSGGKLEKVARLQRHVGHASISTTMSYLDISDEEQRKWYDDLWKEKEED